MRGKALAILLSGLWLYSGCEGDPDFVAETQPLMCDPRSRLVRRGFPENLDALFANLCRVERTRTMRGPDFTFWLGQRAAATDCSNPANLYWTEKGPDGSITAVNFCDAYCARLHARLLWELSQDACAEMMVTSGGAGAPPPQP